MKRCIDVIKLHWDCTDRAGSSAEAVQKASLSDLSDRLWVHLKKQKLDPIFSKLHVSEQFVD